MSQNYFQFEEIDLKTALTLLTNDIFNQIKKDVPNCIDISLHTPREKSLESIPVVISIYYKTQYQNSWICLDFSNIFDSDFMIRDKHSPINEDDYKIKLLELFPDIINFSKIDYIRLEEISGTFKPDLIEAKRKFDSIYLKSNLDTTLKNNESLPSGKFKI